MTGDLVPSINCLTNTRPDLDPHKPSSSLKFVSFSPSAKVFLYPKISVSNKWFQANIYFLERGYFTAKTTGPMSDPKKIVLMAKSLKKIVQLPFRPKVRKTC